jgi:DNA-binding FadR family transcriptional regulator
MSDRSRFLAADLQIHSRVVLRSVSEMIENITNSLPRVTDQFVEMYGQSPVIERLPLAIRKQIRRIARQL